MEGDMSHIQVIMVPEFFLLAGIASVCAIVGLSWTMHLWEQRRFIGRSDRMQYGAQLVTLVWFTSIAGIVGFVLPLGVSLIYLLELIQSH